jgi:hypothetical protein
MKNFGKLMLATCTLLAIFIHPGCSKSSSTPLAQAQVAAGLPTMTATCNGSVVTFAAISVSNAGGRVSITAGLPGQTSQQALSLYTTLGGVGTVTLNGASTSAGNTGLYGIGPSDTSLVKYWTDGTHTGTMSVTSFDPTTKIMAGTFNFNAVQFQPTGGTGTATITNGSFANVKLP